MSWEFQDHLPIYAQLMDTLKRRIVTGRYLPGEKLPSVRELAAEAGINPNTVQRALAALDDEGLTVPKRTAGRYVATDDTALHALRQEDARAAADAFIRACRSLGVDVEGAHGLVDERWNADL